MQMRSCSRTKFDADDRNAHSNRSLRDARPRGHGILPQTANPLADRILLRARPSRQSSPTVSPPSSHAPSVSLLSGHSSSRAVEQAIKSNNVLMIAKSYCPYCNGAVSLTPRRSSSSDQLSAHPTQIRHFSLHFPILPPPTNQAHSSPTPTETAPLKYERPVQGVRPRSHGTARTRHRLASFRRSIDRTKDRTDDLDQGEVHRGLVGSPELAGFGGVVEIVQVIGILVSIAGLSPFPWWGCSGV